MSHAAILVSPTAERIKESNGDIEQAVAWEMQPFDENDECFRDGSRWDWYVIGGRFTGKLSTYDPYVDEANMETCWLCRGTGIRPNGREEFGEEWFKACNGCNGCSGKGKTVKSRLNKFSGDIIQVKQLNLGALRTDKIKRLTESFYRGKAKPDPFEPIEPDMTLDAYLEKHAAQQPITAYAFLRDRHWHEAERMGWFGTSTFTECERKKPEDADAAFGKCLHKDDETGARIVCWNEPWELWSKHYYERFISKLHPEDTLVVVDYHV